MDGEGEVGLGVEDAVGGTDFLECLAVDRHGEPAGRPLLLTQFTDEQARGNAGEDGL